MTIETLPKVDIPTIAPQDLKGMLDADEDFVLLDIRLNIDVDRYWIESPRRLQISLNELTERFAEIPKGKKLVVIDKNGKRSGLAARYLTAKGFEQVIIVSGGMNQWIKSGLPTRLAE